MTEGEKRRERLCNKYKRVALLLCLIFSLVISLKYSELCAKGVRYGIELSVNKLIPSLFPFMVLSDIIVKSGGCELIAKTVGKPLSVILGISKSGAACFLLGMLLGFPVGIRSALSLYRSGRIDKAELIRLSLFSSAPSPAFFISAVGEGMFGSLLLGVTLYLIALLVSLVIGALSRPLFAKYKGEYASVSKLSLRPTLGAELFIDAVSSSALSLLSISAFVVFFSMLSELLEYFFSALVLASWLSALLIGALEMTGGVARASTLGASGIPLAAASLGFSGISVLCQIAFIRKDGELPLLPYFLSRIFSAGAYFLLSLGAIMLFGDKLGLSEPSAPSFILYRENSLSLSLFVIFICALFVALRERGRKNLKKTIYKS